MRRRFYGNFWRGYKFSLKGADSGSTRERAPGGGARSAVLFHRCRLSADRDYHVVRCAGAGKLGFLFLDALCRVSPTWQRYRKDSLCEEIPTKPRIKCPRDTEAY